MLNQGRFGYCSAHACATACAHAIGLKYGLWAEPSKLLDKWFDKIIPHKPQWPDEFLVGAGAAVLREESAFREFEFRGRRTDKWEDAVSLVRAAGGFKCIVLVLSQTRGTHCVVGIRVELTGTVICQNSWGAENAPFLKADPGNFVRAYLVEPFLVQEQRPGEKTSAEVVPTPCASEEWKHFLSLLPYVNNGF